MRFYHDLCSTGNSRSFIGVSRSGRGTFIDFYSAGNNEITLPNHKLRNPLAISEDALVFHDECKGEFGAIHGGSKRYWMLIDANATFVGGSGALKEVAVQSEGYLKLYDLSSGELVDRKKQAGQVVGFGPAWKLVDYGETRLEFFGSDASTQLSYKDNICFFSTHGERVAFIERQGAARVVDKREGRILFEEFADAGSEFRRAAVDPDGMLTLTQHYFNNPRQTLIHQFELESGFRARRTVQIPVSGVYSLIAGGEQIVFATRQIFSCRDGTEVGTF